MFEKRKGNLGMGKRSSLALIAAAFTVLGAGAAQADIDSYVGSTMTKQANECCGFDFSFIHPLGAQYGPSSLGVPRQIANTPITFSFNDTDNNGLDSGDALSVVSTTMSLGNIGGGEVTLTVSGNLTVGGLGNFDGSEHFNTDLNPGTPQALPTHLIGGQLDFTITRGSTSFSDFFVFATDEVDQGQDGPANGIFWDESTNNIAVWLWGQSSDRMCEWNTNISQCDGPNSTLDPGSSGQIDLAEDLFFNGCVQGYCQHYFKKQYIGINLAFFGNGTENLSMPEPGSLAVFGAGLIGMGIARRRKARA